MSEQEKQKAEVKVRDDKKNRMINIISIIIIISSFVIATSVLYSFVLKPQSTYKEAVSLFDEGNFVDAKQKFLEIEKYKDSSDKIYLCDENIGQSQGEN